MAVDPAGEPSTSKVFAFEVDITKSTMSTIDYAEDNVGPIKDNLSTNAITDDPQPILHDSAERNSVITIYNAGGIALGSVTADANGA